MPHRFSTPTRLLAVLLLPVLFLYGCATPTTKVSPDPVSVPQAVVSKSCGAATLIDLQPTSPCATCPYIGREFATILENISIFTKVTYVTEKPERQEDILLGSTFEITRDENFGSGMVKAVFSGLLFMLPVPFIWYDEDYILTGQIQIETLEGQSTEITSQATGIKQRQLFSDIGVGLGTDAVNKAKNVLFRQLALQLAQYCGEA